MARREIWRHIETGDFYVVEVENSELIGAGGPFSRRALNAVLTDGFNSNSDLLNSLRGGYTGFRRLDWYENMLLQKARAGKDPLVVLRAASDLVV